MPWGGYGGHKASEAGPPIPMPRFMQPRACIPRFPGGKQGDQPPGRRVACELGSASLPHVPPLPVMTGLYSGRLNGTVIAGPALLPAGSPPFGVLSNLGNKQPPPSRERNSSPFVSVGGRECPPTPRGGRLTSVRVMTGGGGAQEGVPGQEAEPPPALGEGPGHSGLRFSSQDGRGT